MQFHVLGQLRLLRDGAPVDLGSRMQRVLLAALLVERGRTVSSSRLVDLLWPDDPPPRAEAGLQAYVSRLRRALEPTRDQGTPPTVLVTRGPGYALVVDDDAVDACAFADLAGRAACASREHRWDEAALLARRALELGSEPFLVDLGELPFLLAERRRLGALRDACREALVVAALGRGHVHEAVAEAERWADDVPDDEGAQARLALALHRAGRTVEALDRLRRYRAHLAEQTGSEMGRELTELQAALLAQDGSLDARPSAPGTPTPVVAAPAAAPSAPPARLVGRQAETAALDEALRSAGQQAQWVVLTGPAGIGKTTLSAHAAAGARRAVWARCPDDTVPAWWPLRQLVRSLGHSPEELLMPAPGADADTARFAVYERVTDVLLRGRPDDGVLTVVVDDVQWADETSLGCLTYLADTLVEPGVLVVLTLRDDELPRPPVQRLLATLARQQRCCVLPVPPLSAAAVGQVLSRLTGEPVSGSDAALLALRTAGNPLFVTEYARLPEADRRDGRVPSAVRSLFERRLARLPDDVVEVLRTAAVVGEDFDLPTVAAASAVTVEDLVHVLDVAVSAQVVVAGRAGGTGYGFAHALLRDAVLSGLTAPRRQLRHARVAQALSGPYDAERLARRAGHLLAAGPVADPGTVRGACVDVADDAERRLEFSVASSWWQRALDVAAPTDDQIDLELRAVRALARAGRPDAAVRRVDDAFAGALASGDLRSAAALAGELVHVQDGWTWTVFGEPRPPLLDRLREALELARTPHERVPLLGAVATGLHLWTRTDERLPYADEAVALAREAGDRELLRSALGALLMALVDVPRELDRSAAAVEELERALGPVRDRRAVLVLQTRADLLLTRGHVRASAEAHERTVALSDALRLPGFRAQERWSATRYAQWTGDLEHAEALRERARTVHEQTGVQYAAGAHAQSLLSSLWLSGRLGEASEQHLRLARGYDEELWRALVAQERGEVGEARSWLDRVPVERHHWWGMLSNLVLTAHVVADLGQADRAQAALDALTPYAGLVATFGHFGCAGPVDLALGRLLALLGRPVEAAARLAAAHALAVREDGRPFAARAARALADLSTTVR